jgi:hypothetical protein
MEMIVMKATHPYYSRGSKRHFPRTAAFLIGGAVTVTSLLSIGSVSAQTTTTVAPTTSTSGSVSAVSTTTAQAATSVVKPTSTPAGDVTLGTSVTQDTVVDSPVPEGGIDAGFGGTAENSTSESGMPIALALLGVSATAVFVVSLRRRRRNHDF